MKSLIIFCYAFFLIPSCSLYKEISSITFEKREYKVSIIKPSPDSVINSLSTDITGTAQDNLGIDFISYSHNGGDFKRIMGKEKWSFTLTLEEGKNNIIIKAIAIDGYAEEKELNIYRIISRRNSMTTGRRFFAAIKVNERIYVFGGLHYNTVTGEYYITASTEYYDMQSDTWHALPDMTSVRFGHAIAYAGNKIYILGGKDSFNGDSLNLCEYLDISDPANPVWGQLSNMMNNPRYHFKALIKDNYIYAFCGFIENSIESYNLDETGPWQFERESFPQLYSPEAISVGNNIYLTGGVTSIGEMSDSSNYIYEYDTVQDIIIRLPVFLPSHLTFSHCLPFRDGFAVIGGENNLVNQNSVYYYNCISGSISRLTDLPFTFSRGAVLPGENYFYILGGSRAYLEETSELDDFLYHYLSSPDLHAYYLDDDPSGGI